MIKTFPIGYIVPGIYALEEIHSNANQTAYKNNYK